MSVSRIIPACIACLLVLACAKPPEPAPPKPSLTVDVRSDPEKALLALDGKPLGEAPRVLGMYKEEDLLNLQATLQGQEMVEKRIRFISLERAEITFVFGKGRSMMGKALGLPRILVFDYGAGVTFDLNRSVLKPEFLPLLDRQSSMLKASFAGLDVFVCGHTDNLGTAERNLALSLERAEAVATHLAAHGVPKERLKVQGFASQYPVADNGSDAGRALNRRTELVLPQ
ncbi:MAG: OmpA family protein [Acidobacteria bacterium]|nr:OmpA family protein [Acidobacteriota bacterium]